MHKEQALLKIDTSDQVHEPRATRVIEQRTAVFRRPQQFRVLAPIRGRQLQVLLADADERLIAAMRLF
jgi:hypothetical protein